MHDGRLISPYKGKELSENSEKYIVLLIGVQQNQELKKSISYL